jgi:rhodanese-related sulfurtransferase
MWQQDITNWRAGTVIDVRSKEEYELMHTERSVNIPWDMHLYYLEELKHLPKPWMFCCEEGFRSGLVAYSLSTLGHTEVYNIGSWDNARCSSTPA